MKRKVTIGKKDFDIDTYHEATNFLNAYKFTAKSEGSDVDETLKDKGKRSRYGITQNILDQYAKENGLDPMTVDKLTPALATNIAFKEFYNKKNIELLPSDKLKMSVFDYGFHSGAWGIKDLQKIVGATPDGVIGGDTIDKVQKYIDTNGEDELVKQHLLSRNQRMMKAADVIKKRDNKDIKQGFQNRFEDISNALGIKY